MNFLPFYSFIDHMKALLINLNYLVLENHFHGFKVWSVIKWDERFSLCAFTPQKIVVFIELQFTLGILCLGFRVLGIRI